ncbi:hypothetical protein [Nocardioides donggukensis]|uniref:Uncharacterized protein n=1 Tax=Nocardioides donggukensis TaxID=2774019 RepID=A0A927K785_9ACTN|nr:hypothetical protein [Nocardioides donggukensis]MBD8871158.1 hypothetical protein [Nocardioides donggukensis]
MPSIWNSENVLEAIVGALDGVHLNNPQGHHFGRPFLTGYQLAIKVDAAHPEIRQALGPPNELGGEGTGVHHSFAQYLARELSRNIRRHVEADEWYPVQGRFLSNEHVTELRYRDAQGLPRTSSLTGTGFDLALFRLRGIDEGA